MAAKKGTIKKTAPAGKSGPGAADSVFISHVHEDEKLAEAFALLIQSVTAGGVLTYRSSSKTLGEGIQYGEEWFRWICDSVNAASHTVALITPASTGRPWILFEAGLGKAKPNGVVFGLALGIKREDAYKGPFAVLQNCGSEANELKKLCKQLIEGRGLNPPEAMIENCVEQFRETVKEHFKSKPATKRSEEDPTTLAVFQALEEMKAMARDQEQPGHYRGPSSEMKRVDLMMMIDMVRFEFKAKPNTQLQILGGIGAQLGYLWMPAYLDAIAKEKSRNRAQHLRHILQEMTLHGQGSKLNHYLIMAIEDVLHELFEWRRKPTSRSKSA